MSCILKATAQRSLNFLGQRRVPQQFMQSGKRYASLCSQISIIGGGQMAEAILNSIIVDKVQDPKDIIVYDINAERVSYLVKTYGVIKAATVQDAVDNAEIVVLAVKPQNIKDLAASITTPPKGMILSIVAGCTIKMLKDKFRTNIIMRTMPNTPAMISEGITVWTTSKETPKVLHGKGEILLRSIGDQVEVSEEKYLDMATAISGSGPAVSAVVFGSVLPYSNMKALAQLSRIVKNKIATY
jgi:pyrroline-5-carboxylate reductase